MSKWRKVAGSSWYEVSDGGDVRSWRSCGGSGERREKPRPLTPRTPKGGYPKVNLTINGKATKRLVHRLVLEAFVGPCPCGFEACHGNGDKSDARLSNLRWGSRESNIADRARHGVAVRGTRHGMSKLTEEQVLRIRKDARRPSIVAMDYGIHKMTAWRVQNLKTWVWLGQ